MQVTIIGGGSYQWAPKLITDLLATPSLSGMRLVLEDIDPAPLESMGRYARMADDLLDSKATVDTTTDQGAALDGADFVVVTISTGGFESMAVDLDVPAQHGIVQSVGDSVGPGGISRSLRNIPVLVGIGRDMEARCPDAWLLNITNPMTCLTRSVTRETGVRTVGLCHEVGNFSMLLAVALGLPHTTIRPTVAGVNHFPVVTALEIDGRDGFDVLREMVDGVGGLDAIAPDAGSAEADPFTPLGFGRENVVKLTLLDRTGAIPAAGDRHLAEFLPGILTEASGWGRAWGITPTPISTRREHQEEYVAYVDAVLAGDRTMETWDSGELVAPVIDSLVTGTRRELPLNLPNAGQCPDLPRDAVVESICVVDGDGIRGRDQAGAPPALAEVLRRHVAVQEMTVEAALTGDRTLVQAAMGLDPLAGRGDQRDTEAMVDELLAGAARWLPQFTATAASAR
jgi:alpha-galactosidase/6-phospho-beta-glucosidase family protein